MSYNTDKTKFSISMNSGESKQALEGWVEYDTQDGYSLQKREVQQSYKHITQYRKVHVDGAV